MENQIQDIDLLILKQINNETTVAEKECLYKWITESDDNHKYFIETVKVCEKSTLIYNDKDFVDKKFDELQLVLRHNKVRMIYKVVSSLVAVLIFGFVLQHFIWINRNAEFIIQTSNLKKEITLPDGSNIWLNKNSKISYYKNYTKKRDIHLIGEAYFNIKKDEKHPFTVFTENLTIQVLGTKFIVHDFSSEQKAEAVLESGSINLKIRDSKDIVKMNVGQKTTFDKKTMQYEIENIDVNNCTSWINNQLIFENSTLQDVFSQMEKWYGIKIICESESIKSTRVSLTIDKEPKEEILNNLQQVTPFLWRTIKEKTPSESILIESK